MIVYVWALAIGIIAGLRSMTAPAAVSWAARLGYLHLEGSWLAFFGYAATPYIVTLLAVGELIADKLPGTPSRKAPLGFGGRVITGGVSGAAIGAAGGSWTYGLLAGMVGAVIGTLGGYELRRRLVTATGGKDLPIAMLEDAFAIVGAIFVITRFS